MQRLAETIETNRQTYNALDLAKFIMSVLVVMIHIPPFGSSASSNVIYYLNFGVQNYLARIAVPFFFISAGYLLFRKTSYENFNLNDVYKYVKRILKLYAIWTLIYLPLSILYIINDKDKVFYEIALYIRNTIFTGSYIHLWYLNALIFSAFLVGLLLNKRIKPLRILSFSMLLYFVGLFAQSWFGFIVPIREKGPEIWQIFGWIEKIIVTTRNGLFEGFLFVAIGMCYAFYNIKIKMRTSFLGLLFSMLALFVEIYVLKNMKFIRDYDMFLFLVPAAFFLFSFVCTIELPNKSIYKTLRELSFLIYCLHLWVDKFVAKFLELVNPMFLGSFIRFLLTLVATIIVSLVIVRASKLERAKWLVNIYK